MHTSIIVAPNTMINENVINVKVPLLIYFT